MNNIWRGLVSLAILRAMAGIAAAQRQVGIKTGLTPEDWTYAMPEGVTFREVTFYSDGVGCYGKLFFPKRFVADEKTPGVVVAQGWAGTHFSVEKYGARLPYQPKHCQRGGNSTGSSS